MKHIARLLICLMFVTCSFMSCDKKDRINVDKNGKGYPVYIYKGSKWDILQINDSVINLNKEKKYKNKKFLNSAFNFF